MIVSFIEPLFLVTCCYLMFTPTSDSGCIAGQVQASIGADVSIETPANRMLNALPMSLICLVLRVASRINGSQLLEEGRASKIETSIQLLVNAPLC